MWNIKLCLTVRQCQCYFRLLPLNFGIAIAESVGGGILIIIAISELSIYGVI